MEIDIHSYDYYIINYSGGKDSTAIFLWLLEQGIDPRCIELWHQCVDGKGETFFDWEVTPDYCRQFAKAFNVKVYFQWKKGGFYREMMRKNCRTAPTCFETENGCIETVGGKRGNISTRLKFPQCSSNLAVRWCSSYLKIGVASTAIVNQRRFLNKRTLVLSGERGEESAQRAKYAIFEPDKADCRDGERMKRHVDRIRPIRDWKEQQVWEIIERYRIRVHPCYYMGWNRCSCKMCVFGNKDQFASAAYISPEIMCGLISIEKQNGYTMKRNIDLTTLISKGTPFPGITNNIMKTATGIQYKLSIIIPDNQKWLLPAGAYKRGGGPN
ncbi:MAG: phosphoadenosine phosphosulfate reductase family protein [Alistipes sp.]|nr:phosphoadenosine phosphosulfate reductase family protein [Alistipes sp.]